MDESELDDLVRAKRACEIQSDLYLMPPGPAGTSLHTNPTEWYRSIQIVVAPYSPKLARFIELIWNNSDQLLELAKKGLSFDKVFDKAADSQDELERALDQVCDLEDEVSDLEDEIEDRDKEIAILKKQLEEYTR